MKNANKIINRKKKIDKIIYNSNKDTNNKKDTNKIKRSNNLGLNINLKRIKETKENEMKKSNLSDLILKPKGISVNKNIDKNDKNNENNNSDASWESDLGDVGEIIEDEGESELPTELNDLNELSENNFINNPKSISIYSSIILLGKKEKKRMSLSLNKTSKSSNFFNSFSSFFRKENDINQITKEKNYNNFKDSKEIFDKIKKKENDIEKVKKLIEIIKRNIKYYDKEIIEVNKFIQNEEKIREEYQLLINFLNLK